MNLLKVWDLFIKHTKKKCWGRREQASENLYTTLYFKVLTIFPLIGFYRSQGIWKPTSSTAQAAAVLAAPDTGWKSPSIYRSIYIPSHGDYKKVSFQAEVSQH